MMFLSDGTITVPPEGNKGAKICLVGEAPGAHEVRRLRPFIGPAGGVLEECMHAAGLTRSECYLTNIFKFRVKKDAGNIKAEDGELLWHSSKGFTKAGLVYIDNLREELLEVKANVIVPLGNTALDALFSQRSITKWRGSIVESTLLPGRKLVPTIHPSAVLQSGDYLARYKIVFDLRRAKEESEFPEIRRPMQNFVIQPTFQDVLEGLCYIEQWGLAGRRVNFDIEIINHEVSCISFALDIHWAICIPFHRADWTEEEEACIWRRISDILSNPKIPKVNQNILFDVYTLAVKNKILTRGRLDDPMTANHIIYPDFPKGLDFLTSIHTRIPYYKDDGKVWKTGLLKDKHRFWRYNCQDSAVSAECMNKLDKELDEQGYRETYEMTLRLYPVLLDMMIRGIRADRKRLDEAREEISKLIEKTQQELNEIVGYELNVNSSKQCQEYFYVKLGIKPYYSRKTGKVTTDDKAMARLAKGTATRPGLREAKLVQRIRALRKLQSTYLDIAFDEDSRIRCSFNPRGTTTGRLSSSQTLFGTGMNLQNLPPEFKQFLVPDPGYIFVEIDKAQAEWVVVAYYSGDARMMEVIEQKLDPHLRTGQLISGVEDTDLILRENKVIGHSTDPVEIQHLREQHVPELLQMQKEGKIFLPRTMSIRQCGKKSNHGFNYGMGYKTFALHNEIPETEAKMIRDAYHKAYPGIESTFWAGVRRQLRKDRTLVNCFGRKRRFLGRWGPDLFNQAYDFIGQSTVVDLINIGMVKIYEDTSYPMDKIELLAQVHDSILFQFPIDFELLAHALRRCLKYLNPVMVYSGRRFRIASDIKIGLNWRDMVEVDLSKPLELALIEAYEKLFWKKGKNCGQGS